MTRREFESLADLPPPAARTVVIQTMKLMRREFVKAMAIYAGVSVFTLGAALFCVWVLVQHQDQWLFIALALLNAWTLAGSLVRGTEAIRIYRSAMLGERNMLTLIDELLKAQEETTK